MLEIREPLLREYERWLKLVGDDPYSQDCVIGIHDVLRAHFLLVDYFFGEGEGVGGVGPKNLDMLHSAVSRQIVSYGGRQKWKDEFDLCATLFYGLIKNHPFHDCNKRTALLIALYYLQRIGKVPGAPQRDFENLTVRVAEGGLSKYPAFKRFSKLADADVLFISNFLRRNTRVIDKHHYIISYNQLSAILSRYGFRLSHPSGNYIDVVKDVETTTGFIFRKKQMTTKRVVKIGFPGWKTEVNMSTIKRIREATTLTTRDGVDSAAFFHGADSMEALISTYKGPLERLARK
jgi:death-on-curing family protein